MMEKVYVVEDMAVARAALIQSLEDNDYGIAGSAASAEKAWSEIKNTDIDIVLVDINLTGEHDGIWLAQKIRSGRNMPLIFLTAYGDKNTLNQLKALHPNGYLMKPYNEPTLITTISIAIRSFYSSELTRPSEDHSIFIKNRGMQIKLEVAKILYIKSDGNYIDIYSVEGRYTIREKLESFLELLHTISIIRVHQRYAVNTSYIKAISNHAVFLPPASIPVSKKYRENLLQLPELKL
ncbi:response regulator transcription factor [Fulvivirga ulvae]|uniref:LytR/AlgR family response regulator transcription factor n=1 Tax=Fulvivirga ulvae TaxID=2904245 RepID=UPI001F293658|nr:response regulator transcription factor [Fulvivirga ulvae]UII33172.1 response regulator transcription factor [Fulvivirga ulvae]